MEASKVTITNETRDILARPMSQTARRKLQYRIVMDYIRSKPAGTNISIKELAMISGRDKRGTAHYFITSMEKKGLITRIEDPLMKSRYSWTVNSDTRIVKPANAPSVESKSDSKDTSHVLELAKQFAWIKNSDSLREFVAWLGER